MNRRRQETTERNTKQMSCISNSSYLIETICRRLLIEATTSASNIENLAAYTFEGDGGDAAVLYRPETVKNLMSSGASLDSETLLKSSAVVGYIGLQHHDTDCWAASEILSMVGKGYGKILYDIGYALSPSGILMMDREIVSPAASASWLRAGDKLGDKNKKKFDARKPNNKTPEAIDDCDLFPEPERAHLNYAHKETQDSSGTLSSLMNAHNQFIKSIGPAAEDTKEALYAAGAELFHRET